MVQPEFSSEQADTVLLRQLQTSEDSEMPQVEMAEAEMAEAEMAEAEMAEAETSSEHAEAGKEDEIGLWEFDDSLLW